MHKCTYKRAIPINRLQKIAIVGTFMTAAVRVAEAEAIDECAFYIWWLPRMK